MQFASNYIAIIYKRYRNENLYNRPFFQTICSILQGQFGCLYDCSKEMFLMILSD